MTHPKKNNENCTGYINIRKSFLQNKNIHQRVKPTN